MNFEEFMKLLAEDVRDASIRRAYSITNGSARAPTLLDLSKSFHNLSSEQKSSMEQLVARTVDNTIFHFLLMLEENAGAISVTLFDGKGGAADLVDSSIDGLSGEILTDLGWFGKHSKFPVY